MKQLAEINVPEGIEPIRIYDYCLNKFPQLPSRKSVKKAIDAGLILLNNETTETGYWLKGGEHIQLIDPENTPPKTYELELEVHYEDDHLAVIYKPAGLLTSGNAFKTVQNALQYNLQTCKLEDAMEWPKPVHRLDKATSGLLIIAKSKTARQKLGQQFENGSVQKTYHAVVLGDAPDEGLIETPIDGKTAVTEFKKLRTVNSLRSEKLSLLELHPKTGRTHQLRIHLSEMGHAILGDPLYSPQHLYLKHKGMFLCATQISFENVMREQQIEVFTEIPKKFVKRLENEEIRWIKHN